MDEVYLDFQVLPPEKDRLNVLLVAFPKNIIDQFLAVLKKAGIVPVALETESQAIARVLSKNNIEPPYFVISFGESNTIFTIFSDCSPHFSSSIGICSQDLTKAISQSLNVGLNEAEELKLKQFSRKDVFEAMEPVLNDLADQIKKYISYYQTYACPDYPASDGSEKKTIEKIVLCGKGASLSGLQDFFSSKMGMPVKLTSIPKKEKDSESLGCVSVLGLALRGIEKNYD